MNEKAWDEEGTRRVVVSFSVEIGADDDRTSADLAEAILAEYGHRGGDATMFLEPLKGAMGRAERFVASGGDTEVLLEGLPETSEPRPGVFDLRKELGRAPTAQEYRDAGD